MNHVKPPQGPAAGRREAESMEHFQIRFYSAGVREGLECMEKSLTNVRDKLDILEEQREVLMTSWEGSACRQWNQEFMLQLNRIGECLKGLGKLTDAVNEIAVALSQTEKNNEFLADQTY